MDSCVPGVIVETIIKYLCSKRSHMVREGKKKSISREAKLKIN